MSVRFLKDVSWYSLGNLIVGVVFFAYLFLMARLLGKDAYGLFQALMGIHGLIMVLGILLNISAMHLVGTAAESDRPRALGACLRMAAMIGSLAALGLVVASPAIARGIHAPSVMPVLCLATLIFVSFLLITFHGGLQGSNRYRLFASARVVESLIVLGCGVLLVSWSTGATGALGGYLAGSLALCLLFFSRRSWYMFPRGGLTLPGELRGLVRLLLVTATLLLVCNLPVVIARSRLSSEQSGDVGALFALRYTVLAFAEAVVWPLYTRTISGNRDAEAPRVALLLVITLGLCFAAVGTLFPTLFFRFFFGTQYLEAADYMALYGVYLTLHMVSMVQLFDDAALNRLRPSLLALPVCIVAVTAVWPHPTVEGLIGGQCAAWLAYLAASTLLGSRTTNVPS